MGSNRNCKTHWRRAKPPLSLFILVHPLLQCRRQGARTNLLPYGTPRFRYSESCAAPESLSPCPVPNSVSHLVPTHARPMVLNKKCHSACTWGQYSTRKTIASFDHYWHNAETQSIISSIFYTKNTNIHHFGTQQPTTQLLPNPADK